MKLQHLSVIFIIILLPIILVLSTYIGTQIDTLNLQTAYNTKLNDATHDAMQAFQLNTQNNEYSTVADSLKRDVGASINTFYTSMAANMGVSGYSGEELHPYIPAVLYTMYDGYYIYSPTKTEAASEAENLLKQYIYYSARYVNDSNNTDVVINYSLDSYISVYGIVKGEYVARSGYLIQYGSSNGLTKINNISIDNYYVEIDGETYGNTSGTKIKEGAVWSDTGSQIAIDSVEYNGATIKPEDGVVVRGDENKFEVRRNETGNSASKEAIYYYLDAFEFSKYISEIELNGAIENTNTKVYINEQEVYVQGGSNNKIIAPDNLFNLTGTSETDDPENLQSNFVNHKREIIRLSIENNLQNAFNNYKGTVGNSYDYQLPKFKEEEWEKIYKNVSVVTFMQGIQVGSKMYNNYSIVTSTANEEYVDPEELYFINGEVYYRITDNEVNVPTIGYRSSMFEKRNKINGEEKNRDILSEKLLGSHNYMADYNSIVNANVASVYSDDGELAGTIDDNNKKEAYYTSLARERYEILKLRATSILNTSQTIKTRVLASAQATGITEGEISATIKPANMFSANNKCTYKIEGTTIYGEANFDNGNVVIPATGLQQNTEYIVTVSAIDDYGRTVTDVATFTTGTINTANVINERWVAGAITATVRANNLHTDQQIYVKINDGDTLEFRLGQNNVEIPGLNKDDKLTMWVQRNSYTGAITEYKVKADDNIVPDITISNIVTTPSSITLDLTATDNESGFREDTKFDVRVFPEEEEIQGAGGEFGLVNYEVNKIKSEGIIITGLDANNKYYIEVRVKDRYGNEGFVTTKGTQTITTDPEKVPDAKVELIPDNPNTNEDDNQQPSEGNTNIIARYWPTYYVDGEEAQNKKDGYIGLGEKIKLTLEKRLVSEDYSIQYRKNEESKWNIYAGETIEISNNTAYLVRFIAEDENRNLVAGEPDIFNIKNIDKKEPEIRIQENVVNSSEMTIIAEDSGDDNSGLKEFKIQLVKYDGDIDEINVNLDSYIQENNSGDKKDGGVKHTIQGIGYADGNEYVYRRIIITATDCVGRTTTKTINIAQEDSKPAIEIISVTNSNTIDKNYASKKHNIEVKFRIIDESANIELSDLPELTLENFNITVGGNSANITNKEITKQDDIYIIKLSGITGDGELEIKLKENVIQDKVGNGNKATSLLPNDLPNNTNESTSWIVIDNTAPKVTLTAEPQDVSTQAIEANKINEDGKYTTIYAQVDDMSGIRTYKYKFEDLYGLKEATQYQETFIEFKREIKPYNKKTTFGTYKVTIQDVQDRAGNISNEIKTVHVYDYTIKTKEEMEMFRQYTEKGNTFIDKTVTLLNDIDLECSEQKQWQPINFFAGIFEGQNHTISGIYINTTDDTQGLFKSSNSGAQIKNLEVNGSIFGGKYLGGIIGNNYGTISNCHSTVIINGDSSSGGIVGYNTGTGIIENCYNSGEITGNNDIGGIVGNNTGAISNCYNTGAIENDNSRVGGIVGYNTGTVENCYNTGAITGNRQVGGITGQNNRGTISNCYNTGRITGNSYVGEIGGYNIGTTQNCYYNSETSNATDSNATAKTTAEMQAPEFVSILGIENWKEDHTQDGRVQINNGYPILKWQEGKETVVVQSMEAGIDTVTVKATATDSNYKYYQYYITKVGETRGKTVIYSGTKTEYTFESLELGTKYNIEVYAYRDANYSEADRLYGNKEISTVEVVPEITGQEPKVGQTAIFQITNENELPENAEIKWYRNSTNSTNGETVIENATSVTYVESAANVVLYENYYYYASITINGKEIMSIPLQLQVNYTINTKAELEGVSTLVNSGELAESVAGLKGKTVYLGNDINLNPGFTFKEDGSYEVDNSITSLTTPEQWTPIGTFNNNYQGNFDGQNYTIREIYINITSMFQGVFGRIVNSEVKSLSVSGSICGGDQVGGIAGRNDGTILNCYSTVIIKGDSSAGGIAGYTTGTITNCHNTGAVTGNATEIGNVVGGIAGEVNGNAIINNCYNTGTVTGKSFMVGGIVGYNNGTITNCYNTGAITGTQEVGGIVGYNNSGTIENCYYNSETSIVADATATAKTTAEMKAPEFVSILGIENWKEDHTQDGRVQINNGYPILKWQEGKETVIVESIESGADRITVKATATDANYKYYKYYITKEGETRGETAIYSGLETEYTFQNLEPGTKYTVEVYAYLDNSYSEYDTLYGSKEISTVGVVPEITGQEPKVGQTATFQITNENELPENAEIKWYRNSTNSTNGGTVIENATGATYQESAANVVLYENYYYYTSITEDGKELMSTPLQLQVNYTINTKAELKRVSTLVNSGKLAANVEGLKGKTVYLGNDINLNPGFTFKEDGSYEVDTTITSLTTPEQWKPIDGYKGKFDGQKYQISGIYINTTGNDQGLFDSLSSGAEIKNLAVSGNIIRRRTCRWYSWNES